MEKTMKAAVAREFGKPLTIERVPIPEVGPGQVLVKIEACGVCHTDLHAISGDWPVKATLPLIPGHEGVGRVAEVGPGVSGVSEGDLVGVPWLHRACGDCPHCVGGWETLCEKQANTGYSVQGCFAEYALAEARFVGHLPADAPAAETAPILCAGVTVYKGLRESEVRPGEWIVVVGIGGLGHLAVQYARAMGMRVAAVDIGEDKLELAKRSGAAVVANASSPEAVRAVLSATGGAHGALVTAPSTAAFAQAIQMVRRGGTVSLVGLPAGSFPLPIFDVVLKRITVRGSIVGTRNDLREAVAFATAGQVRAEVQTRPLEEINAIFEEMRSGRIEGRVAVTP